MNGTAELFAAGALGDLQKLADLKRCELAGDTVCYRFVAVDEQTNDVIAFLYDEMLPARVATYLDQHGRGDIRCATLVPAAAAPLPGAGTTAAEWLRAFAWLRLALPGPMQILARWDVLGPSLTQLSLEYGVSALCGPLPQAGRVRLPVGRPAPRRAEIGLSEAEVRTLIVRARRQARPLADFANPSRVSASRGRSSSMASSSRLAAPKDNA